jgi:hypothetical protein
MAAERHAGCIHPLCGCAGTANCKMEPKRTVPLNLLARAREHVPYMGETWKALTAAMAGTDGVEEVGCG